MRFVQAVVSAAGFREPSWNPRRMKLLEALLRVVTQEDANLLVLPGGFLTAKSEGAVVYQVAAVAKLAEDAGLAIIGGVDVYATEISKRVAESGQRIADLISSRRLPYFGFAVGRVALGNDCVHPWRQTSTSGKNSEQVSEADVPGAGRLVRIAGRQVGVLICGELFNGPRGNRWLNSVPISWLTLATKA